MTTITVCTTCRQPHLREAKEDAPCGEQMLELVSAAGAAKGVAVRGTACLMGCERGCNIAISAPGKITYVLGKFVPTPEDAEAITDYAALYGESPSGAVPYRQWPQGVKGHFTARIPPLDMPPSL